MAKLTLGDVGNLLGSPTAAATRINANNDLVETAIENTLSRNGVSPNQMMADFDLNHYNILNAGLINGANISDILLAEQRAEAAADLAEGYASDAVSQGNVPIYATKVGMTGLMVPLGLNALRVNGYYAAGDSDPVLYKKVISQPTHAGKFQSADGAWWEIASNRVCVSAFGGFGSGVDGGPAINNALAFLLQKGGGELIADKLYTCLTPIVTPGIGGDPYATRVWSSKIVFKGRGPGTGIKINPAVSSNFKLFTMNNPITVDDMLIDGSSILGAVGFYQSFVTGFARSYIRRNHFIGFDNVGAKAYNTIGHLCSVVQNNFERCYSAVWVDNYGIGLTVTDNIFNGNGLSDTYGPSFAQIYFGQNTAAGVPQGVMVKGNQMTGYGYGILMRAMYVAEIYGNILDMSAPGGTNECIRMEPQTFVDVVSGLTVQMHCSYVHWTDNWFGAGYPVVGANPPFNQPRGYAMRILDYCHNITIDGCTIPQSEPIVIISATVGAEGNTTGAIYNITINDCEFTDMLGTNTQIMLYAYKVSNLYVGPGNVFEYCTMATDVCSNQEIDVPNLYLSGKTPPQITNATSKLNGWGDYTPTPVASSPGGTPPVWGTCTGRFRRQGSTGFVSLRVPVVTPGTGSGTVRITNMPFNAKTDTTLLGIEEATGLIVRCFISSTTNVGIITFADTTYPSGVSGRTICITGSYEIL